jgi:osmoprotectant transport system ATP-binding protein
MYAIRSVFCKNLRDSTLRDRARRCKRPSAETRSGRVVAGSGPITYALYRLDAAARARHRHGRAPGVIRLHNVSKSFDGGSSFAVRDVSIDVRQGETLVLLGSSGCGKTTTLKMINRLIDPSAGRIEVDDRDAASRDPLELRRSIGYVFQDIGLFPHMTVRQNAAVVPSLLGWPRERRRETADRVLELVGLPPAEFARRRPAQLSGGQQQRVGIARSLAADPDYLLMDEPFGALDAVTRDQLQSELLRLRRTLGKTVVFVTHDLFEALRLGDRIGVMHHGRLDQVGTPGELLGDPATPFVAELFGHARRQAAMLGPERDA